MLHPISVQWENAYSQPSDGSMVLATQDSAAEDIWSGSTGIYISQVMPDGSRRARFGGFIPKFNGSGGGTTTVAFHSMDKFLDKRLVAGPDHPYTIDIDNLVSIPPPVEQIVSFRALKPTSPTTTTEVYQSAPTVGGTCAIGVFLVDEVAKGNLEGGPVLGVGSLSAVVQAPYTDIDLTVMDPLCSWWDFKNVGQAVRELVEAESGIKYRLDHYYNNGYWSTVMTFSDVIGTVRDYTILSDREAWQYGLEVDAENKATRVYGVGSGEEGDTQYSIAYDADNTDNLPEHQVTVAWKDQVHAANIDALTRGYVTDHRDPATVPSATIVGLPDYDPDVAGYDPQKGFPGPEICEPGDTFGVEIGYGVITVKNIQVRALAVAWELTQGTPAQRTLAMQPVVRANQSVRTQTPAKAVAPTQPVETTQPPAKSIPWPTPGLVSTVQSADLTEISGMQMSKTTPGYLWVVEDETETPDQVSLLKRSSGERVGYFNLSGVSPSPYGDPEAVRLARVSNRLVVADIGDNDGNRPTTGANQPSLLVVAEPKGGGNKGTLPTTRYPISYPAGLQVNAETLLIHPTSEQVFIVTKEPTQSRVYSFGVLSSMSTTNNVGVLVATLPFGGVSDGTHTLDGQFVLFRRQKVDVTQVVNASSWAKVGTIPTPPMTKSEAITVESACAFLTTSEGANAPIYRVLIPKWAGATCNTQAGPDNTGTGGEGPNGPTVVPGQVIDMKQWKWQGPI